MNNLKEKFYNLFIILKKSIKKFPLTIIAILILTIIYTISLDNDIFKATTIKNITIFMLIFSSNTFLIETLMDNKSKSKMIYYIISALESLIFTIAVNFEGNVLGMQNEVFIHRIARLISCFVISLIVLGVYFNYKKSTKTFEEYVTNTLVGLFKITLIYGILAIGVAIITAIFVYLILSGGSYVLVARLEILLLGFYYIPTVIYGFYNQEEDVGKFAKIVIKYVLGTLVISAFVIIYLYILKILILRSMPSNQIFRILSALFICSLPIWTMIIGFKENETYYKINSKLPFLFIPFIFLQIYSILVRINANGFTEARYLCLMHIVFEIIYIIMYWKNKGKIGNILIVFVAFTIISTIVPYVNMFKISITSQVNNLKIYTQKTNYTEEEENKISGAYYYLKNSIEGKKYIEKYLNKEDIEEIKNSMNNTYSDNKFESIYANKESKYIEIKGYSRLYKIYSDDSDKFSSEGEKINKFKNIKFDIQGEENDTIKIDMENIINRWIEEGEDLEENFSELNELEIDRNRKIIFDFVSIEINKDTQNILYYNFSGYLLEK